MPDINIKFKIESRLAGPPLQVICDNWHATDDRLNLVTSGIGVTRSFALDQIAEYEVL